MNYLSEQNIFIFLVQLFLLLGLARGMGELFRKWKQPPLTAEILAGLLLGPTIFGRFFPPLHAIIFPSDPAQQNMLETVSWLGVLFLLLETGLEIDFSSAWRQRGEALTIALTDIAVPITIAFGTCMLLPDRYLVDPGQRVIFAVFMATVMTISAMPTAARALHDLNLSKTDLGFLIMSALSVNDIIGWLIFTVVLVFFTHSNLEITRILMVLFSTVGFTVLALTVGRKLTNAAISWIKVKKLPQPGAPLTFICLLGILCGAITQKIGIYALFGFFIAGIMSGGAKALSETTRQVISQMVYAVFVPLFFAGIGLKLDFLRNFDIFLVAIISVVGISAKFAGAWLGVAFTKLPRSNRIPIAIAHTPGGAAEIVIGVLALKYHLITEPIFIAIVFGAVLSSIILGPLLDFSIRRRKEVSVLEFFSHRSIIADLDAEDKEQAISRLCAKAVEHDNSLDMDEITSEVLKREDLMGTAMEEGMAIPHARLRSLNNPVIVFGRSLKGIDWNSPDGAPSHFIFMVLMPEYNDIQIQVLSVIAKSMLEKGLRDRILAARDEHVIWEILREKFSHQHVKKNKTGGQK